MNNESMPTDMDLAKKEASGNAKSSTFSRFVLSFFNRHYHHGLYFRRWR